MIGKPARVPRAAGAMTRLLAASTRRPATARRPRRPCGRPCDRVARDRGVGRDDAVDAVARAASRRSTPTCASSRSGAILTNIGTCAAVALRQFGAARLQRLPAARRARSSPCSARRLRVFGLRDVDGHVVGVRHRRRAGRAGSRRRRARSACRVLADVQPDDAAGGAKAARALHVGDEGIEAVVVEAEPVDQRLPSRQPEHARLRVARLRPAASRCRPR